MVERDLQPGLEILGLHGSGTFLATRQFIADPFQLLLRQCAAAAQFRQLVSTLPLREFRLTQLAFFGIDLVTLVTHCPFGLFEARPCADHHRLQLADPLALQVDRRFGDEPAFALAFLLHGHLGQTFVDLRLPFAEAFAGLRKLQCFDLNGMRAILQQTQLLT